MVATSYSGPVRIFDTHGNLLAVGTSNLEEDEEGHSWKGTIEVMAGTGVAGKALVVDIEADGRKGRAQMIPVDNVGDVAHLRIVGLGPRPF